MIPQTDKSWRDYRSLNQNWSYRPTLAGRAILKHKKSCRETPWSSGERRLLPSEHLTLLQRQPNVDQTSWMFGHRWVDVVLASRVHWVIVKKVPAVPKIK